MQCGVEKNENSYVYHLTAKDNLNYISRFGLIPALGDKTRYIGDNRNFVYFSYYIEDVIKWYEKFYTGFSKDDMVLLRFRLNSVKYFCKDFKNGDLYTWCAVPKDKIEYLNNYCESGILYNIDDINKQKKLGWRPFIDKCKK